MVVSGTAHGRRRGRALVQGFCHAVSVALSQFDVQDRVGSDHLPQLMDLFASTWWAAERTDDEVRRMVAASDLVVAVT